MKQSRLFINATQSFKLFFKPRLVTTEKSGHRNLEWDFSIKIFADSGVQQQRLTYLDIFRSAFFSSIDSMPSMLRIGISKQLGFNMHIIFPEIFPRTFYLYKNIFSVMELSGIECFSITLNSIDFLLRFFLHGMYIWQWSVSSSSANAFLLRNRIRFSIVLCEKGAREVDANKQRMKSKRR